MQPGDTGKGHAFFTAIAACFFSIVLCAHAQPASAPEYEVKAAFIYNFAKFVEWPEGAFSTGDSDMVLCVANEIPFGKALESIRGKTVKGRRIVVRQYKDVEDIAACHILFIGSSERKRLGQILEAVKGRSILTVGDEQGFAQQGGIINFIIAENKVSFEINLDAARRAGLEISSKLLRLAEIVREKP